MSQLPTRLRRNSNIRNMVKETRLSMDQIIYPIFLVEGNGVKSPIASLKGQDHMSIDVLIDMLPELKEKGIRSLLLFGTLEEKDAHAGCAYEEDGLIQRAIRQIKAADPQIYLIADLCLCQYKSDGHCCFFTEGQEIDRKKTLDTLGKVALSYAECGLDMVAPSDMMDGRVAHIRQVLDQGGYEGVAIMAYSAKYASSFYGPFRDAAHSAPSFSDRKTYQMDPANRLEARREIELDLQEGADVVMVKPAMVYQDIIADAAQIAKVPVAAYQVSGEYALLVQGIEAGIITERAIYESLIGLRRSGATLIITYFAKTLQAILEREASL